MSLPKPAIFGLVILAVVALIAIVSFTASKAKTKLPTSVSSETKAIKQTDDQIKLTSDIEYPFVTTQGSNAAATINASIDSLISSQSASFKQELKNTDVSNLPPEMQKQNNEFFVRYKDYRVDPKIYSTDFEISTMFTGAAHPNTVNNSYNFSFILNKALTLGDLFKNPNYLEQLSQVSKQKLQTTLNKGGENLDEFINPGTQPKPENFSNFTLTDNSLIIIFDPYQVAPYAWGTQTVEIPFTDLGADFRLDLVK